MLTPLVAATAKETDEAELRHPDHTAPMRLHSPRLLDDPAQLRSGLEASGVALQLFYNQFLGWRARGGSHPDDALGASGSYDLFALLDLEELAKRPGLELLLQAKGLYDRSLNKEVVALSDPVDDADFDAAVYLSQLWLQQNFGGNLGMLRLGFLDQQTEFDRNAFANSEDLQFASTFLDNNPLVPLQNGLGAVVLVRPFDWLELSLGISDADNSPRHAGFHTAFDGFASLSEVLEATLHLAFPTTGASLPGAYRFGLFRDGRERAVFESINAVAAPSRPRRGHYGAYLSVDQALFREDGEGDQGLGLFGRAGYADPEVNRIEWFGSLGFEYRGPVPSRNEDVFGAGAYQAIVSEKFSKSRRGGFDRENGVEFYYRVAVLPWLTLTPHLQYIASPGGDRAVTDAIVALLRIRISL